MLFQTKATFALAVFAILAALHACAPARDTVLKDVERNYTATGFLDTETFQVRCTLDGEKLLTDSCETKLVEELVFYKERFDRDAFAKRMHPDFRGFLKPEEATDAMRAAWRITYRQLAKGRTRVVFESRKGDIIEAVYRLRAQNLIYRVQHAEEN